MNRSGYSLLLPSEKPIAGPRRPSRLCPSFSATSAVHASRKSHYTWTTHTMVIDRHSSHPLARQRHQKSPIHHSAPSPLWRGGEEGVQGISKRTFPFSLPLLSIFFCAPLFSLLLTFLILTRLQAKRRASRRKKFGKKIRSCVAVHTTAVGTSRRVRR